MARILEAIGRVVTAILDLPAKIISGLIQGLKDLLIALFVPSDTAIAELKNLADKKLPVVAQLENWNNDLQNIDMQPYKIRFSIYCFRRFI